jgi:hypothetical protein
MNTTTPTPAITPNDTFDTGGIFLVIGLSSMIFIFLIVIKVLCPCPHKQIEPQIATPIVIEIPIAVSISIQTLDNEHIGTVL